jgi:hypothetical protein
MIPLTKEVTKDVALVVREMADDKYYLLQNSILWVGVSLSRE